MKKGAGVVAIKDGQILLVKAGPKSRQLTGTVSFPGGNVEPGETEEQAARREFQEETGLTATKLIDFPGNYIEATLVLKTGTAEYSFKVFLAQEFSGKLQPTEETEPFWLDIEEARKIKLFGKNNEILESLIKFLSLR